RGSWVGGGRGRGEVGGGGGGGGGVGGRGGGGNELLEPKGMESHTKAKKRQLFRVEVATRRGLAELLGTRGFNTQGTLPFVILPKSSVYIKPVRSEGSFWIGCDDEINRPYVNIPPRSLEALSA